MDNATINIAKEVFRTEIESLEYVAESIGEEFSKACDLIANSSGRVIVCGMGKSGIIGKKIAASLASTGTPSFFMHPGEAYHGDLGMITPSDVFVALSNSGETEELIKLIPFLKDNGNQIVSLSGNEKSTLALASDCHLNVNVKKEACPLQLAPTSSTTACLVMGDALTVALMRLNDFKPENFARFHPGGSLGRRLLHTVKDEMKTENLPLIEQGAGLMEIIHCMTRGRLGIAIVLSKEKRVIRLITDGDLRRVFEEYGESSFSLTTENFGSTNPLTISKNMKMELAFEIMEENKVTTLLVEDDCGLIGVLKK